MATNTERSHGQPKILDVPRSSCRNLPVGGVASSFLETARASTQYYLATMKQMSAVLLIVVLAMGVLKGLAMGPSKQSTAGSHTTPTRDGPSRPPITELASTSTHQVGTVSNRRSGAASFSSPSTDLEMGPFLESASSWAVSASSHLSPSSEVVRGGDVALRAHRHPRVPLICS